MSNSALDVDAILSCSSIDDDEDYDEEYNEEELVEEESFAPKIRYSCYDVLAKIEELEKQQIQEKMKELEEIIQSLEPMNEVIIIERERIEEKEENFQKIEEKIKENETDKENNSDNNNNNNNNVVEKKKSSFKFGNGKRTWECPVCLEDIVQPFLFNCGRIYCFSCSEEYIKSRMASGQVVAIKCMDPACGHVLSEFEIISILTPTDFTTFKKTFDYATHRKRGEAWCPQIDCPGKGNSFNGKFAQCNHCDFQFCMKCFTPAHPKISCSSSKRKTRRSFKKKQKKMNKLKANESEGIHLTSFEPDCKLVVTDRKSKRWAMKNTKKCPNCKEVIQKNGGCHHVHCTSCGITFCWYCKQQSNSYKHCKKRKAAFIGGSILLSPFIVVGALVVGPPLALAGGIIHVAQKKILSTPGYQTVPYRAFYSARERLGLKIYWLVD